MHDALVVRHPGGREGLLLLGLAAVPAGIDLALESGPAAPVSSALVTSLVGAVFFMTAALFLYLDSRVHATPGRAGLVAAMALLACQLLGSAALAMDPADAERRQLGWPLAVDLVVTCAVLGMAATGLGSRAPWRADPLLVGLALGVVATTLKPALSQAAAAPPVPQWALLAGIVVAYGPLAAIVLRHSLPRWVATHLAVALVGVPAAFVVASFPGTLPDLAAGTVLLCAGASWAGVAIALQCRSLAEEHERVVWAESSLLENELASRASREALHALKGTIAGLAKASALLANPDLPPETRRHLERTVTSELARMERSLALPSHPGPGVVDLDSAVDTVLDLHRVQGRSFSWTPSGASVLGRQDDIEEVLNILLDNAARHGETAHGRVDVSLDDLEGDMVQIAVTDDGPGVPADMRQRIFEWGERGPDSTGQGIGLHMARRLVNEQGGSLTLSEADTGASFVIRLPAARRSEETHHVHTQHSSR